ncbi:MAG: hypothetical protein EA423_03830 [Phycisphaerales bacterium]|nr:MAG: hypothetical protein EA423_03830 [Phycisphaerales bacterium]
MHDPNAEGNAYFKCDYCLSPWSEDRPMVEGHRGSLLCVRCLEVAYRELVVEKGEGEKIATGDECRLCLQSNDKPHWRSPVDEAALLCRSCVKRCAAIMAKDKETDWSPPA